MAFPEIVHCVGAGGAGVSAVAEVLHRRGRRVSGSDTGATPVTRRLAALGIPVAIGHRPENIPAGAGLVVRSAAVPESNVEIVRARAAGIPVCTYAEALGRLMEGTCGVAVAGTHGKSTTTAWIAWVLERDGRSPTWIVGAQVPQLGHGSGAGAGDIVVAEACEYRRTFLHLRPRVAVVTGIEADHLDYYRDVDEVAEAFADFARRVPPEGVVVAAGDDARARAAAEAAPARAVTFGLDARSRVRAEALETGADGCCRFRLATAAGARIPVALAVPGLHNVRNALAAAAALEALGTAPEAVAAGLGAFRGVARRFEVLGTWGDVTVVDDYAHHPTEVAAALATARDAFPGRRLLCVFQPHQHSRTRLFLDAFARSLLAADAVLLPGIYRSRDAEEEVKRTRAADLAARVRALGGEAESLPGVEDVAAAVGARAAPGDVVLTVGAGDIWRAHDAVRRCLAGGRVPEPGARRPGP